MGLIGFMGLIGLRVLGLGALKAWRVVGLVGSRVFFDFMERMSLHRICKCLM